MDVREMNTLPDFSTLVKDNDEKFDGDVSVAPEVDTVVTFGCTVN